MAKSNPAISKILQHSSGNVVFAQMRHIGAPSSNRSSKTETNIIRNRDFSFDDMIAVFNVSI